MIPNFAVRQSPGSQQTSDFRPAFFVLKLEQIFVAKSDNDNTDIFLWNLRGDFANQLRNESFVHSRKLN